MYKMYKMNETINNFLSVENKYMPEIHLKQPECTYNAFGSLIKTKKKYKNLKKQETQHVFIKMN